MLTSLAFDYLGVSAGVGAAALLFLMFREKLRSRFSAASISAIWIMMSVCLLIPVGQFLNAGGTAAGAPVEISVPSPVIQTAPLITDYNAEQQISDKTAANDGTSETAAGSVNLPHVFACLWLAGAAVFITYYGVCFTVLLISVRRRSTDCSEDVEKKLHDIQKELSVRRHIRIRQYSPCKNAFLIGIFNPVILLPENIPDSASLDFILRHEVIHYKNKDIFIKLLALLANALHFYNPMAYVIRHETAFSRELMCDNSILRGKDKAYAYSYGGTILALILNKRQLNLTMQFGSTKKELKRRLAHILDFKPKRKGYLLIAAAVIVIVTASAAFAFNAGTTSANVSAGTVSSEDNTAVPAVSDEITTIPNQSTASAFSDDVTDANETKAPGTTAAPVFAATVPDTTDAAAPAAKTAENTTTQTTSEAQTTAESKTLSTNGVITDFTYHRSEYFSNSIDTKYYKNPGAFLYTSREQMLSDSAYNEFLKILSDNDCTETQNEEWLNQYDDDYFQTKALIMLAFTYGSPSYVSTPVSLQKNGEDLTVNYETENDLPFGWYVTQVMSSEYIFIEIDKETVCGAETIAMNQINAN